MIRRPTAVLIALLLTVSLAAARADAKKPRVPKGKTWVIDMRADTLGQAPSGAVVMGGGWAVLEDSVAAAAAMAASPATSLPPAPPRLLRQRSGDDAVAMNWIRFTKPNLTNCEVSVRFRVVSGELDPGVGLVFQYDAKRKNGYLVRLSGAENELVAHYLLLGRRRDIKMQNMEMPPAGEWHTLGVHREGMTTSVFYDDKEVMTFRDERFTQGEVGLWTEDDTVADFADLKITAR